MKNKPVLKSLLPILGILALMMVACSLSAQTPTPQPAPTDTEAAASPTDAPADEGSPDTVSLMVNVNGVAQNFTSQVVPAVNAGPDAPWWETMPEHLVLTLEGYPIGDHLMKPQIFLYPVAGLEANEATANIATLLQGIIDGARPSDSLPYLPPYNAAQVMFAKLAFLDFQGGSGLRYLTQFDQAFLPINNHELLYTFQGLTSDGKYYVAAVLPVNLFALPADETVSDALPAEFFDNFQLYISNTITLLNDQSDGAFTPDLGVLDAMMQSITVE